MKHRKYSPIISIIICLTLLVGNLSFTSIAASPRRSKLSGINAVIYDALATEITKIASGNRNSASIDVNVNLKNILGSAWKSSYTAQDLGVSTIASGGYFTDETDTAINNMFHYSPSTIVEYLMSDMPYELYWFDKTSGWTAPGSISAYSGTTTYVEIDETTTLTFIFKVASGYSASNSSGTTSVNTTKTRAASNAMTNARNIVNANSSKSDYEKLLAYKNKICELVSYNTAAAADDAPYDDAYQLIYVFDGNAATNVVCEGYAKAFKYLCDQTTFNNSSISCQTVVGIMDGGLGAGDHMWNIVHMEDGKNYIVDVTNCDNGTIGNPNKLFLTGATKLSNIKYQAKNVDVKYTYDSSTTRQFSAGELAIATTDYTPSNNNSGNGGSNNNSGSGGSNNNSGNGGSNNNNSGSGGSNNNNSGNGESNNNNSGGGGSNNNNSGNGGSNNNSSSGSGGNTSGNGGSSSSATKTVRVYFNANGGTIFYQYMDIKVGGKYGFLPYAYRTGYELVGWSTSPYGMSSGSITANSVCSLTYNHTLYAHWKAVSSVNNDSASGSSSNTSGSSAGNNNSASKPASQDNWGYSDNPEGSSEANREARKNGDSNSKIHLVADDMEIDISDGKVSVSNVSDSTMSSAAYSICGNNKLKLSKPLTKAKTVTIPSKIKANGKTYTVTQIGNNAFKNNKKVTKVNLPSTIKKVEKGAFSGASKLKTVVIKGGSKKTFNKIVKMIKASSSNMKKVKFVHQK